MPEIAAEFIALQESLSGEYSIERELGRGGMGIVYLAREVQLDRLVAIKVLPCALINDTAVRECFLREARMAASLSHPNIVPIYRVGDAAGLPYFIMMYVAGETLGERLRRRGPLSPVVAVQLLREVAWALAYAHGRGIIHRDVKPDNILIEEGTGRALVTDFGIARTARPMDGARDVGLAGTAQFMSPEQVGGEVVDGRGDLYSLGVTAFLAVTGRMPLPGDTAGAIMRAHVHEPPLPVAAALPSVPRFLGDAIDRCLRKDPLHRMPSGEALAAALQTNLPGRAELPEPIRAWVMARDPLTSGYLMLSGATGSYAAIELIEGLRFGILHVGMESLVVIALGMALAPLLPAAAFQARAIRAALRSGYALGDLRRGLAARARELELERRSDAPETIAQRLGRVAATTLFATSGAALVGFATGLLKDNGLTGLSTYIIWLATIPLSAAFGVPILRRGLGDHLFAIRARFWNSKPGGWIAATLAPRPGSVAPQFADRPTEMALGAAIDDLFASLPAAYKASVGDISVLVERLERHASAAREHIYAIDVQSSIDGGGAATTERDGLAFQRDTATRELARTVAALEAIRLSLLRLHGGSDLRPITTALEAAGDIDADLRRLRAGEIEVGLESGWLDAESDSLTPV